MANDVDKMVAETTREMENAKRVLQDLANEVSQLTEIVNPAIDKQIEKLRSARMAFVNEVRESVAAMKDIRTFYLNPDHDKEMARIHEFIAVCEKLKALKDAGVFDILADAVIRLGLGEKSQ